MAELTTYKFSGSGSRTEQLSSALFGDLPVSTKPGLPGQYGSLIQYHPSAKTPVSKAFGGGAGNRLHYGDARTIDQPAFYYAKADGTMGTTFGVEEMAGRGNQMLGDGNARRVIYSDGKGNFYNIWDNPTP